MSFHKESRYPGAFAVAILAVALASCSGKEPKAPKGNGKAGAPVPVLVATAEQKVMPVQIRAIGNAEAYATVAVKARVDGQIVRVNFREGQDVAPGEVLFQLDPRPFEAALAQARANLARDAAQLANAQAQERRYRDLLQKNFVSREMYSQIRTNLDTARATVQADQAAVENARLQLEFGTIRSPISGRTGKILIQRGNLVKANDTNALVVINRIRPIYVDLSVPEQDLERIRRFMRGGALPVGVTLPGADAKTASGKLVFVDNAVDATTGTVRLKALFPNEDEALWPGLFVNATLTLRQQKDAVVVPSQAVQTGPRGQYVFVVKPDDSVEMRDIAVDRSVGAETVVAKGLAPGERVVTVGQLRLVPGAKVDIKPARGTP